MKVRMIKTKDDSYLSYKALSRIDYANALSFYHSNFDTEDARQFLKDYLSARNTAYDLSLVNLIDKIPDIWIPLSASWIARLLILQCSLPEIGSSQFVISRIEEAIKKIPSQYIEAEQKPIEVKIKSLSPKKVELLTEIDEIIDDMINGNIYKDGKFSFYGWLKEHEAKVCHIHVLIEKTEQILEEYELVLEGTDEDLLEGYSHLTRKDIQTRIKFYSGIIEDAEKYIHGAKQSRKPRKKKIITCDMKLKYLQWKNEDVSLKITSIHPNKILGAMELYVFDTKYKKLTHFVAQDEKGLDIYRTAITSFNEKESHTYPLGLKKTEMILTELQNGGRVHKKKIIEQLKISPIFCERINENIILLAVY